MDRRTVSSEQKIKSIYHIDAYRIKEDDIINLGWEEIVADKNNVIIVEWADRIEDIIPKRALWVEFEWVDKSKRKITLTKSYNKSKLKNFVFYIVIFHFEI